ncbi:MAG: N,N-dimethylformamidase beta subunit family domain-containing protein, partial [Pseudomonadota bacterium]
MTTAKTSILTTASGSPQVEPDADWIHRAVHGNYAERPFVEPPQEARIWSYTDRVSYRAGEAVALSVNTNAPRFAVSVIRDGADARTVFSESDLSGIWRETPDDCSVVGCAWPVSLTIETGADWPSGGYIVRTDAIVDGAVKDTHEHLFILTAHASADHGRRLLLIASTATWTAYNDWGGSNHYQGFCGPDGDRFSPILSVARPFAKGFVTLPSDAPRAVLADNPAMLSRPRYPHMEWAYANGYSKKYMSAGWASYDRHFVQWAEAEGYSVDVISQTDLHYHPEILEGYACVVMVGHCEYWSWKMRDAIDDYVDRGGKVARFAGNFLWQIRLEDTGTRQICYKHLAQAEDPLMQTGPRYLVTDAWETAVVGRPGAQTFGLNGSDGVYAGWSGCSPRGAKGFTIYRPEHWAFADTGLYYGDVLGSESRIFGYEVDGLAYEIRDGLPVPADP